MTMVFKSFEHFNASQTSITEVGTLNESIFDKLSFAFSRFLKLFSDPYKLQQNVEAAVVDMGEKTVKFLPSQVKLNNTVMVLMTGAIPENVKTKGKEEKLTDFTIAFTKISDLPDGSGLFYITGTTSQKMLKALTGTDKMEDLISNNVLAVIPPTGFVKDAPITMKILKSIIPGGKDYVSNSKVKGAILKSDLDKIQKLD